MSAGIGEAPLVIGSRKSRLARIQTDEVIRRLQRAWPALRIDVVMCEAWGDERVDLPFTTLAPDAFTDRLDTALRSGEIDAAVHSFKDMPREPRAEFDFCLAAVPVRADNRDALVSADGSSLDALPAGAVIGTSSARRTAELRALRPDCEVRPIRGTVDVRLERVLGGEYDAAVFAVAGLQRLGLERHIAEIFELERFPPAAGQGALAVQCRADDDRTRALLVAIDDAAIRADVAAECASELMASDTALHEQGQPLLGRHVLVTRPESLADELCLAVERLGGRALRLPLTRIEAVSARPHAWESIGQSDVVIFTSVNGVSFGWDAAPPDARAALRAHRGIVAIGPATAAAANACGLFVQRVATPHVAEALVAMLGSMGESATWIRGADARDILPRSLRGRGMRVTEIIVYRSVPAAVDDSPLQRLGRGDFVTLTSPLCARRFAELGGGKVEAQVVCIGPVTEAAAREAGLSVAMVADPHTVTGLADALARAAHHDSAVA